MSSERLNILVLHRLGDPLGAPYFLKKHVFFLQKYFPEHNYIYHDIHFPFPAHLKDARFHLVIFDVTFLCLRWFPRKFINQMWEDYSFLRDVDAVKLAFPQDEYDCSAILDDWLCRFNIDVVYSVCPDHADVIYPRFSRQGKIMVGYTGYVDDEMLGFDGTVPFKSRRLDVSYRTSRLPYNFGRIGELKSTIGDLFLEHSEGQGFVCDISNRTQDKILGNDWLTFLSNSKFVLGSNSGSSLLDPQGEIRKCVRNYCDKNPKAPFEEVEEICFPGLDGQYEFTALSPRTIEAAVTKCGQVLVKGDYSHVIEPWKDYIPLEPDFSNKADVFAAMKDAGFAEKMIDSCYEKIVENAQLSYRAHGENIIHLAHEYIDKKHVTGTDSSIMQQFVNRYQDHHDIVKKRCWRKLRRQKKIKNVITRYTPGLGNILRRIYIAIND